MRSPGDFIDFSMKKLDWQIIFATASVMTRKSNPVHKAVRKKNWSWWQGKVTQSIKQCIKIKCRIEKQGQTQWQAPRAIRSAKGPSSLSKQGNPWTTFITLTSSRDLLAKIVNKFQSVPLVWSLDLCHWNSALRTSRIRLSNAGLDPVGPTPETNAEITAASFLPNFGPIVTHWCIWVSNDQDASVCYAKAKLRDE